MIFKVAILIAFFSLSFSEDLNSEENFKNNEDAIVKKRPEIARKLSFFIPGGGQFYNEKYLKGLGFLSSELICLYNWNLSLSPLSVASRNSWAWLAVGVYLWNIVDAYIDAELSTFPDEREILEKE